MDILEKKISEIRSFQKNNENVLLSIQQLFFSASDEIFKETCKKELKSCEPEFCMFRLEGTCDYPKYLSRLNDLKLGI